MRWLAYRDKDSLAVNAVPPVLRGRQCPECRLGHRKLDARNPAAACGSQYLLLDNEYPPCHTKVDLSDHGDGRDRVVVVKVREAGYDGVVLHDELDGACDESLRSCGLFGVSQGCEPDVVPMCG